MYDSKFYDQSDVLRCCASEQLSLYGIEKLVIHEVEKAGLKYEISARCWYYSFPTVPACSGEDKATLATKQRESLRLSRGSLSWMVMDLDRRKP